MSERRFTRALGKPGMAAQLRETVSQVVRDSTPQCKQYLVDPIDFENFILKNKTLLHNDSHRELLLYPSDDISHIVIPKEYRTVISDISKIKSGEMDLFVEECINNYFSNWNSIHYKYAAYSGSYFDLPGYNEEKIKNELSEEIYEMDIDFDQIDENFAKSDGIAKEGYLLKGPEFGINDRTMFSNIGSKSFKRRYCNLRQQVDGTYILEFFKDEKKGDVKIANLDFCSEIVRNPKRGKYCFELKMNGPHKSYTLAADNESELQDWTMKLNTVLQHYKQQDEKQTAWIKKNCDTTLSSCQTYQVFGTLKGLEQSMNPQLIRYSQETDITISLARKKNRKKLFQMYLLQHNNKMLLPVENNIEPYKDQFNQRIFIKCDEIKFRLQIPMSEHESLCQVEPYYTTLSIFDARYNKKLSENFYFDINHECMQSLFKTQNQDNVSENNLDLPNDLENIPITCLCRIRQAIFNISNPHPDIFLVLKIDKILQGSIYQTSEPYIRTAKDSRLGMKVHKQVQACYQRLGSYRMPFAWTARPLFKLYSNELDCISDFPAIYRQEGTKLKDEELLKMLCEYRKSDRLNKLTTIPGQIKIKIAAITQIPENCLSTSLALLKPFPIPPTSEITLEIAEFESTRENEVYPFTTFMNHLYVYPQSLLFDTQKIFSRARNITCIIEMKDDDSATAPPLKCIYGRPGASPFISKISCPVLHHNETPSWYEEIKMRLPLKFHKKHHLLFSFYHISCDLNKRKENVIESCLGYAWLPLLNKGRHAFIEERTQILPVATDLPDGYLSIEPLGLGKGYAGPEILWIDSQKPIFTVTIKINSTVFTNDIHLDNLFIIAEKITDPIPTAKPSDSEVCKVLKAAHDIQLATIIKFLPIILNQLFTLLTCNINDEVGHHIIRLLIHIIDLIQKAGRQEILLVYVKYIFVIPKNKFNGMLTVHEQLIKYMSILSCSNDENVLLFNKLLFHCGLFFDIIIKSMALHLLATGRIKMHRFERFPKEYQEKMQTIIQTIVLYIINHHNEMPVETLTLNTNLAHFLKRNLTFMDRGLIFKLVNFYMSKFSLESSNILSEFKLKFLQIICSHEHYISFNLPLTQCLSPTKDIPNNEYCLSDNFRQYHFLAGLILQQVKICFNESAQIRKIAISTLKNLLAKHELDDRYQDKGRMGRIAALYVPLLEIVLENLDCLEWTNNSKSDLQQNVSTKACNKTLISAGLMQKNRNNSDDNVCTSTSSSVKSPNRSSTKIKDSGYLATIAGRNISNECSRTSIECDLSIPTTVTQSYTFQESNSRNGELSECNNELNESAEQSFLISISKTCTTSLKHDKFEPSEIQDLLICFLFVVKYLEDDQMVSWWQQCNEKEIQKFLSVIELSLHHFKYLGKRLLSANIETEHDMPRSIKSRTLPARMAPPDFSNDTPPIIGTLQPQNSTGLREKLLDSKNESHYITIQANLAVEIGLIVLDCLGLFCLHFKDLLLEANGCNPVIHQIINIYLTFLRIGQSENLYRHVFAALRAFLNNYSITLFEGNAVLCGQLCFELLKCCNSKLSSIRQESCALLYLLMRSNFEFTNRKGLTRVHLQVMISVSQMLGNVIGLNNSRFQESLSLINSYACSDKVMKGTAFPIEVQDLNKRIRTILMATAQMREHNNDPEMLLDLEHSLANSYASTPELRHTWLETMARNHIQYKNYSEAACCQLHISALMAEYLKLNKLSDWGAEVFDKISKNIPKDEKGLKLDAGVQDVHYNEPILLEQLETCAELLDKAERFELLGHLYRLIIPMYEKKRNYGALANCYSHLTQTCNKIVQANKNCNRLFGRFYKVAFFGSAYFEQENGVEYIYKEPKVTSLSEISERLLQLYSEKFGAENVKIILDSAVDILNLDPKIAYVQIIYVTPYFDENELENRLTDFERNHDISCFMFEIPFTQENKARGNPQEQWKRRIILTTQSSFPYVKKRIQVIKKETVELSPIQVALDEMRQRVQELQDVALTGGGQVDAKKLQLKLQGSICVTVNAGPLAYAYAFLSPTSSDYPEDLVQELKDVFREFVKICYTALQINSKLISCDQQEYQEALRENYQHFCQSLSSILGESLWPDAQMTNFKRNSAALFNAISGTTNSHSSTA